MITAEDDEAVVVLCAAAIAAAMEAENLSGPQCKTQLFLAKAKFILNFFMEEFFPFSLAFLHLSLIDQAVLQF